MFLRRRQAAVHFRPGVSLCSAAVGWPNGTELVQAPLLKGFYIYILLLLLASCY